jgi:hypothetical protein
VLIVASGLRVETGRSGGFGKPSITGKGPEMDAQAAGTVRDFMHPYLEVVPQDTTIVAATERMKIRQIATRIEI